MTTFLFRHRTSALVILHLLLVCISYVMAFSLRFEWAIPPGQLDNLLLTLPWLLLFRLVAFAHFRLYRGWWRYVGMRDLVCLLKAVAVSSLIFATAVLLLGYGQGSFPRSVLVLDPMLTIVLIGGMRFGMRMLRETRRSAPVPQPRRVLIIGAGDAGELLLREMHNNPRLGYIPVGFLDDDALKQGFQIHGVEVLGTTADLAETLQTNPADELIIAIPSATREQMETLVNRCLTTGLPFKIVPAFAGLSDGQLRVSQLRPVRVEDLLGREPVRLDSSRIRADIAGRRVLITGAGGSIGAELCRQVAEYGPASIALVERSENALYYIEQELRRKHRALEIHPIICDVRDRRDLEAAFRRVRPDLVYHAAAFKHVPMMESHLAHAVENNVFGTLNVSELARDHHAKFVLISTDKAVSPTNIMGATKRLAERIVLANNGGRRNHFVAVRFGNVLGSDGSVVPLFHRQIAEGGPVTVTHPEATRYFMTIPEAVTLVLQASVLPEARDRIVMLEMGKPVKILDLARNLIRLSGLQPDIDVPIVFTGLRPGEKLHEQLTSDCEETLPTEFEKIRIVKTECEPISAADLAAMRRVVEAREERAVLRRLQELVPEFTPQSSLLGTVRERAIGAATSAAPEPAPVGMAAQSAS